MHTIWGNLNSGSPVCLAIGLGCSTGATGMAGNWVWSQLAVCGVCLVRCLAEFPVNEPTTIKTNNGNDNAFGIPDSYLSNILLNIDVPGGLPGLAIASPSRNDPDYYFHWIRDGAVTTNSVINEWIATGDEDLLSIIRQYIESSVTLQHTPNLSGGLGEPKFHIDGAAFNEPWGRPQNDGPALRALVIAKYARTLSQSELESTYNRLLKADLEYIADQWQRPSFDLWEELYGYHFFTSLMQYGALKAGAIISNMIGNSEDASYYAQARDDIEEFVETRFLSSRTWQGAVCEHYPCNSGGRSGMDAATVIATVDLVDLAGWTVNEDGQDLLVTCADSRIRDTISALISDMTTRYPINKGQPGGIGRYPEDMYDGHSRTGGNPWFICTASVVEALSRAGELDAAQQHLDFIELHGWNTLSEQINKYNGYMQGAQNLTWSYTSTRRARQTYSRHRQQQLQQQQQLIIQDTF